jgi:putative toxin-antitoxin system antitoxin component (TIGR02293 family)
MAKGSKPGRGTRTVSSPRTRAVAEAILDYAPAKPARTSKSPARNQPKKTVPAKKSSPTPKNEPSNAALLTSTSSRDQMPEFKLSSYEKMGLIQKGISKKGLEKLKDAAGLDYNQLSQLLNVARATLINKKGEETFNPDVSDKILGLADIYSYGYEVFEDAAKFNHWIFQVNKALGGRQPFELLNNSFGREEVKQLIGRIDHGIYS